MKSLSKHDIIKIESDLEYLLDTLEHGVEEGQDEEGTPWAEKRREGAERTLKKVKAIDEELDPDGRLIIDNGGGQTGTDERFEIYVGFGKYFLIRFKNGKPVGVTTYSDKNPDGRFGAELGGEVTETALLLTLRMMEMKSEEIAWAGRYYDREEAIEWIREIRETDQKLRELFAAFSAK